MFSSPQGGGTLSRMDITHQIVVFDAADMPEESGFWARLLGGEVDGDTDWHTVRVNGEPRIAVQLAPDHIPPDWPDGAPQQVHVDFHVTDIATAHREALDAGARLLQEEDPELAPDLFRVYASPAGHPFCLCWR